MRVVLNETPLFDVALQAVDAVDKILAKKPEIKGLEIDAEGTGFTYIDDENNHTAGMRRQREEDSDYAYSLSYTGASMSRLQRADFTRAGYTLYLTHQSEPLDKIPALQKIAELGRLAAKQNED